MQEPLRKIWKRVKYYSFAASVRSCQDHNPNTGPHRQLYSEHFYLDGSPRHHTRISRTKITSILFPKQWPSSKPPVPVYQITFCFFISFSKTFLNASSSFISLRQQNLGICHLIWHRSHSSPFTARAMLGSITSILGYCNYLIIICASHFSCSLLLTLFYSLYLIF